ncbi:MAG: hypothetical protein WA173_15670 [Pseudomonas sp.]|uniref:hypothetical protein n=1 Tax=Pseudomonas sp. TaxID=306 RepID=UPI003BB66DEC
MREPQRITLVIETATKAFDAHPPAEIARLLRAMADRIEVAGLLPVPRDANGVIVGSVTFEPLPAAR